MSRLSRQTRESEVRVALSPRGGEAAAAGVPPIRTGDAFLDHMLTTLARYAGLALEVEASADLRHHLVEDVAITVGLALHDEIAPGCARYGEATVPMDDALVHAALDAGGRFYYQGPLPSSLYDHFLRSLAENAGLTLHVRVLRGRDRHHIVEAAFKAVGLALRQALARESTPAAGCGDATAATDATDATATSARAAGEAAGAGGADYSTAEDDATTAGGDRASNVAGERVFSTKGSVRIERQESPPEHPATRTGRGGSRPERPATPGAREGTRPERAATPSAHEGSRPEHPATQSAREGSGPEHPATPSERDR